jgi:hypothetical protein
VVITTENISFKPVVLTKEGLAGSKKILEVCSGIGTRQFLDLIDYVGLTLQLCANLKFAGLALYHSLGGRP